MRALLALVYAQSGTAAGATLICSGFVVALFRHELGTWGLLAWLSASTLVLAHRLRTTRRFRNAYASRSPDYWLGYIHLSVLLSGSIWGALFAHLIGVAGPSELAMVVLLLCMLAAGATLAYAQLLSVLVCYTVPLSLPGLLALSGGFDTTRWVVAAGILVWFGFMARGARRLNAFIVRYIDYQHENLALTANLEREKSQVLALNDELQEMIGTLVLTRSTLRRQKDKAEELSAQLMLLSARDSLTGLANRREFDRVLAGEWQRARRAGHALTVVLIDVDFFKNYNDTYGHPAGDNCLRQVARVIKGCCRRSRDVAARIGGEEFAVLLPETSVEDAAAQAERLRVAVEALAMGHSGSRCATVITASFGVAGAIPAPDQPEAALLERADRALYEAKSGGRNRVAVASSQDIARAAGDDAGNADAAG